MSPPRDINDCLSVLRSCCTLRYPLSPLRGQQQSNKNKRWMLSTREWLTMLPTSRRWITTRLVMMLHSPRAAPMFAVLRMRFATSSMPSCSTVRHSIAYFAAHLLHGCRRAHQETLRCFASYGRVSQHRRCQVAQPCVSLLQKGFV